MLRKLGFAEMAAVLLGALKMCTPYPCYDVVPDDAPSPLLFVEVTGKEDRSTKTMYIEAFTVYVHAIAAASNSRMQIYKMIQDIEEALTEEIKFPHNVQNLMQTETGVQSFKMDDSGEYHAVIGYEFLVNYGFRVKGR